MMNQEGYGRMQTWPVSRYYPTFTGITDKSHETPQLGLLDCNSLNWEFPKCKSNI
jgi:hypothetical protein